MCGRTACTLEPDDVCKACTYKDSGQKWKIPKWRESSSGHQYYTSYNMAPTSHTPVMMMKYGADSKDAVNENERIIQPMYWGLVPFWHKGSLREVGLATNNARVETILDKRMFSVPLKKGRRCVILADGYYEWKGENEKSRSGSKQPYFIYFPQPPGIQIEDHTWKDCNDELWTESQGWKGPRLLTMAGVYDIWKDPKDETLLYSYAIITMDSSPTMSFIHERMPAILDGEDAVRAWLDFETVPLLEAVKLIVPVTSLTYHPVSKVVGNSKNKSPECIMPIELTKKKEITSKSSELMRSWLKSGSPLKTQLKKENATEEHEPTSVNTTVCSKRVNTVMSPFDGKPIKREKCE